MGKDTAVDVETTSHPAIWLQAALAKLEDSIVGSKIDAQEGYRCVTSVIASTEGINGAAIAVVQDHSLTCVASSGVAPQSGSVLNATSGLYAECFSSGRMVWCRNASNDPRVGFGEVQAGVRSVIVLPLWLHGRVRGILATFAVKPAGLTPEYMTVLGTAAEITSLLEIPNTGICNVDSALAA